MCVFQSNSSCFVTFSKLRRWPHSILERKFVICLNPNPVLVVLGLKWVAMAPFELKINQNGSKYVEYAF